MNCSNCGCASTSVIDSRPVEEGGVIRRRRACSRCKARFTTYEVLASTYADASHDNIDWNGVEDARRLLEKVLARRPPPVL